MSVWQPPQMPGKRKSIEVTDDLITSLGQQLKLLQPASYLAQVIEHS